ncbi:hypothetical protein BKA82DRAFT_996872 [Pisolithus tinctorius]|uniref:Uncharacterized protein n=1 Tax=Pisolithus tinctorius Marx 270 TaxID=870435 RepID=A0A0C3P7B4_PISTI|nr:hypothetical protein BKA82DRAFT_996872 [Pisolithus tinctorius]KIO09280.1 hypothetical protein M404DRAFT_996872 [Pisolithus tinctorius Marx 270]
MSDGPQIIKLLIQSPFETNATVIPRDTVRSPDPAMQGSSSCGKLAMSPPGTGLVGEPAGTAYVNP